MEKEIKVKAVGRYGGHSIKTNKSVDLTLAFRYDEIENSVRMLQMLNNNIEAAVKVGDSKPQKLGLYMIKSLTFGSDGESKLKLNSQLDYVEPTAINTLAGEEQVILLFKATVELESGEPDEDN